MSKNHRRYILYKFLSMFAFALPLVVLFAINHKSYIKTPTSSFSFFGYILMFFLVLGFRNKITEQAKKDVVITVSLVVFIVAVIMYYLAAQLMLISFCSLLGAVLCRVFSPVCDYYFYKSRKKDETSGRLIKICGTDTIPHRTAWKNAYLGEEVTT